MKKIFVLSIILLSTTVFSQENAVDASNGGTAETVIKDTKDTVAAEPVVEKQKESKIEAKKDTKVRNVIKSQPKKEAAAVVPNDNGDLSVLDIADTKLTDKRIPEIKLPEDKVEQVTEVAPVEPEKTGVLQKGKTFEQKLKTVLQIGLGMVVLIIIAILMKKDRKKRRKVFKVSKR